MSNPKELNAFELDRLELFANKILIQCLLHIEINRHHDPDQHARDLATLFERSVETFDIRGAAGEKEKLARELMRQYGVEAIAGSVRQKPAEG